MLEISRVTLFIHSFNHSILATDTVSIDENERTNSSKSFSVRSLRLPRGTLGVDMSSSSIVAELEDVCRVELVNIIYKYKYTYNKINIFIYLLHLLGIYCVVSLVMPKLRQK
jgi:hypothetical protein